MMDSDSVRSFFRLLASETGLSPARVFHNTSVAVLYEEALRWEEGAAITAEGALSMLSGERTGRSPKDKRITEEAANRDEIWWGPVNIPMDEHTYMVNHERALDYLKTRKRIYIVDGFAGWHPKYRLKIRVICSLAYHG
jgi:phosphoenolpyruvate carboxykinase (ATP)